MSRKIVRVLGKRGRITIPYEIRVRNKIGYNDILSFEEKFQLLLRDVYTTSYEGLQQILKAREQYHAMDLNSVKQLIDEYEDEYGTNLVNP